MTESIHTEQRAIIAVVDDDAAIRRGLHRVIECAGYLVEEFESAHDFLERQAAIRTACLVLDVRMPRMSGIELFDRLVQGGVSLPVVFLTGYGSIPTGVDAMKKGAVDFLLKPVDDETLLQAIREAVRRHAALQARDQKTAAVHACLGSLSTREHQVMERVVRGLANKVIAADLGITEKTVKVHRQRVMQKTGSRSLAELVRLADADSPGHDRA